VDPLKAHAKFSHNSGRGTLTINSIVNSGKVKLSLWDNKAQ